MDEPQSKPVGAQVPRQGREGPTGPAQDGALEAAVVTLNCANCDDDYEADEPMWSFCEACREEDPEGWKAFREEKRKRLEQEVKDYAE